jgi:hypothetical protein
MFVQRLGSFGGWLIWVAAVLFALSTANVTPLEACGKIEPLVQEEKWSEAQVALEEYRDKVLFEHSRRFEKLFPERVLSYPLEPKASSGESFGRLGGLLNLNSEYRSPGLPSLTLSIESGENRTAASIICNPNIKIPAEDSVLFGYRARYKAGKNASPMCVICPDDASVAIS